MEITLGSLLLMINEKEKDLNVLCVDVLRSSTVTKDREVSGVETILNEVEDFQALMVKYELTLEDLIKYKNTLAISNSTIKIESGMTIIEAINKISYVRKELFLLDTLTNKKPSLERKFDGNGGSSFYRVTELNFNIDEAKDFRNSLKEYISKIEAEIQVANATSFVII